MPKISFAKTFSLFAGVTIFSLAISLIINAWTEPSSAPPNGNIAAPINTGNIAQRKLGDLTVGVTGTGLPITSTGLSFAIGSTGNYRLIVGDDGNVIAKTKITTPELCLGTPSICYTELPSGGGGSIIGGSCSAGEAIKSIDAAGNITCTNLGGGGGFIPVGGCTALLPPGNKKIFVTNATYLASSIASIADANLRCQTAANAAGLGGSAYKALIHFRQPTNPFTTRNPLDILPAAAFWNGSRIGVTNNCMWYKIANSPSDMLTVGTGAASETNKGANNYLWNPINFDERGQQANVTAFTNFQPTGAGNYDVLDNTLNQGFCKSYTFNGLDWTHLVGTHWYGYTQSKTSTWAYNVYSAGDYFHPTEGPAWCRAQSRSLYCVEQ